MTREQIIDYIEHGREIEFRYQGKMYSITYSPKATKNYISFCEFYKEPTDVATAEELFNVTREGVTVLQMLESLTPDDIWIY